MYDGNDKRVKTFNALNNQTTVFVYDASGDLAAEYTINVPAPTNPTISYLTEDALGSVRVVTNSFGDVKARRDFLPFGEELFAGIGSRNVDQKYSASADDTRKKFATYQRDAETGLDYAQSRYYSAMQGRITSPDEFKGGPDELFDFENDASDNPTFYADLTNPQSLNKYRYSYNNPYKYNDPSGHCPPCSTTTTMPWWIEISTLFPKIDRPNVGSIPNIQIDGKIVEVPRGSIYDEDGSITASDGTMIRPPQYGRNSPYSAKEGAGRAPQPKARPKPIASRPGNLKPVPGAKGTHSTARRDSTGKVKRYTTWEKNPKNPTGKFIPRKSVDTDQSSRPHINRKTKRPVPAPHTQSTSKNSRGKPRIPGDVRPARKNELPYIKETIMETLGKLQKWYFAQCNGEWEHDYGVFIENADNPGWIVTVDISETELEDIRFEEVDLERSENDWFFCRVEDNKFKGFGGPFNLIEILEVFLSWSENKK